MFLPPGHKLAGRYECRGTKWLEGCEVVMLFQYCLGGKAQCRAEGPDRSAASVRGIKILLLAVRVSGCSSHS